MPEVWQGIYAYGEPVSGRSSYDVALGPGAGISRPPGPVGDHSCPGARLAARGLPLRPQRSGSAFTRAE
jgi:hypothetical protein